MVKPIEERYQKKNLHEHILDRPDTYIGSNKIVNDNQYVFNSSDKKIIKKNIDFNPSLVKIVDEILVNAIDRTVVDNTVTFIKVNLLPEEGRIEIANNGKGIPVVKHSEYNVYIPEMIFGELLTSSNYDDDEQRVVGGKNGLGAKLTCIYSKFFSVETVDEERGLYYYQEFTDNMYKKSVPVIKKTKVKSYTKISFKPDFARFKLKKLSSDIIDLLTRRVYDCTACTNKNVSVYLNGEKLKQKDFLQYIALYFNIDCDIKEKVTYEKNTCKDFTWEYAVSLSDNSDQVSFVNGIFTAQGGKHVDHILNQIVKKLTDMIKTKKKIDDVKPSYIKDRLFIFVKATVVNPNFSSQTKEHLTTPVKDFGCKIEVSDSFITKLYSKSGIVEEIVSFAKYKRNRELVKSDGNVCKRKRLNILNLEDAHNAGTSKSKNCTLILTEGLSAKTFAMSGLSIIGRDNFGIFPLKGKCVSEDTLVHLWDGYPKLAKDIKMGDTLIGDDGTKRKVISLFKESGEMYEVFQDGKKSYKVNGEHILTLCMPEHKQAYWCNNSYSWKVYYWDNTTKTINFKQNFTNKDYDNITAEYIKLKEFLLYIDGTNIVDIPIKDYLKFPQEIKEKLKGVSGKCVKWKEQPTKLDPFDIGSRLAKKSVFLNAGLVKKYIPREYIVNSEMMRLKLIAGIIDWAGYITRDNTIEIHQEIHHQQLIQDIIYLCRSLGFNVYVKRHEINPSIVKIEISGKGIFNIPYLVFHGNVKQTEAYKIYYPDIKVKKIQDGKYVGIGIDGNNRFLINDFTVTHNCLNVREATQKQLMENQEFINIKKILGLQHGMKYTDKNNLRYGKLLILTDADNDGVHIRCLIVNIFHLFWPELLEMNDFLTSMRTPIVKVSKNNIQKPFYSIKEYNEWALNNNVNKSYNIKYYKGLGTSTSKEAKDIFKIMNENIVNYISNSKPKTDKAILLAFEKKKADERKLWLQKYNFDIILDQENTERVNYEDLINKELIHFSIHDVLRSIPCICDGLKPSQRKVIYTMFKKNYKKEIKVAQLAAAVSEATSYHHGESSLYSTIVNMAQNYSGSNNINLLKPNGQFGCLDPDTDILLFDGTVKKAKEISVGETLVGDDLKPRTVLRTTSGEDDMFIVALKNKKNYTVNSQHILTLKYTGTDEFIDIKIDDLIKRKDKSNFTSILKYLDGRIEYVEFCILYLGKGKFNGWELDGNKRFLLANNVVTHNSRIQNGKDSASPRYIYTELNDITKRIFNKDDLNIVTYQEDDGEKIEPIYYVPILPLVLVNGANGIGTGYSTNIPSYNPEDIVKNMKLYAEEKRIKEMIPYYKNFKGRILKSNDDVNYIMHGEYSRKSDKILKITEIPIGVAIDDYKQYLEKLVEENSYGIVEYVNYSTETKPEFDVIFNNKESLDKFLNTDVEKILKLTKTINTTNLHLIDQYGVIRKYNTASDILKSFINIRLEYNEKRKNYLIDNYEKIIDTLKNKIRFLEEIMDEKIIIYRRTKGDIINTLEKRGYSKIDNSYDYLTNMYIYSFSKEKLDDFYKNLKEVEEKNKIIKSKSKKDILLEDLEKIL